MSSGYLATLERRVRFTVMRPTINPDKVCHVILKARQFDAKEAPPYENDGSDAPDDGFRQVLADTVDDPALAEIVAFIRAMNVDEQCELVALCWTGRGDFTAEEWPTALKQAEEMRNARAAEYLTGMPTLGDFLEEGLAAFDLSCESFEKRHL